MSAGIPAGGDRFVKVSDIHGAVMALLNLHMEAQQQVQTCEILKKNAALRAHAIDCVIKNLKFLTETGVWLMPAEKVDPSALKETE